MKCRRCRDPGHHCRGRPVHNPDHHKSVVCVQFFVSPNVPPETVLIPGRPSSGGVRENQELLSPPSPGRLRASPGFGSSLPALVDCPLGFLLSHAGRSSRLVSLLPPSCLLPPPLLDAAPAGPSTSLIVCQTSPRRATRPSLPMSLADSTIAVRPSSPTRGSRRPSAVRRARISLRAAPES
jgi:hypothetical protein